MTDPSGYDIQSAAFFADPNPTLHRLRAERPVLWHDGLGVFVLTRYDDVQHLLRDERFCVSRGEEGVGRCDTEASRRELEHCNRFFDRWLVYSDPPRHTALRAVATKAFSPQMVEALRPMVERTCLELLEPFVENGEMDLVSDFALPLPALVSCEMLGLPKERLDDFQRWGDDLFALFRAGVATPEIVEKTHRALEACRGYFEEIIARRRAEPGQDLVSRLALARDQQVDMTEEDLVGMCIMLMAGAHELTAHAIANGTYAFIRHPEQLQLLRRDRRLLAGAVEEMMRYDGPTFRAYRRALVDTEMRGVPIAAGQKVFGVLHAANHDPAHFPNPDVFDIERKDNRHLGLGTGIHVCLAAALVRLETQIAMGAIVEHVPELRLRGEAPTWIPNYVTRRLRSLPVAFTPRA